ncbi:hypothetical protein DAI22_12g147766 [Oryza sativa Japonica Group]|jgi:hypothetical protein|nr:hypothetical protein DAI22_12g147766 [Oryza sativa Japonica Group]
MMLKYLFNILIAIRVVRPFTTGVNELSLAVACLLKMNTASCSVKTSDEQPLLQHSCICHKIIFSIFVMPWAY